MARVVYSVFCSKNVKEFCLSINGAQSVRLGKGSTEFKNYFKQIPVPFKIYADFECNLKSVESYEGSYSKKKKKKKKIPSSFSYKLVWVDDKFSQPIVVFRGRNDAYKIIEAILKEHEYCKRLMKKHFKKNLIMTEEEEKQFQSSKNVLDL